MHACTYHSSIYMHVCVCMRQAISFALFEQLRSRVSGANRAAGGDGTVTFSQSAACSIVTAVIASTVTIPLDVVKTNVMTSTVGKVSMGSLSSMLWAQGGWSAFRKGFAPFLAINVADWGTSMAVYATVLEHYGGGSMGGISSTSHLSGSICDSK